MNGSTEALWEKVNEIAEKGCALRGVHDVALQTLYNEIRMERKEREVMGESIERKMSAIRNQILFGMLLAMVLTLVIDKVMK